MDGGQIADHHRNLDRLPDIFVLMSYNTPFSKDVIDRINKMQQEDIYFSLDGNMVNRYKNKTAYLGSVIKCLESPAGFAPVSSLGNLGEGKSPLNQIC